MIAARSCGGDFDVLKDARVWVGDACAVPGGAVGASGHIGYGVFSFDQGIGGQARLECLRVHSDDFDEGAYAMCCAGIVLHKAPGRSSILSYSQALQSQRPHQVQVSGQIPDTLN